METPMMIRSRLLPIALLALAMCALFPSTALAGEEHKEEIGARNLEKELHRLEETMEQVEEAIVSAEEAGQADTAKQLRATMDALRFVKKQIAARLEGKRARTPKQDKAAKEERFAKKDRVAKQERAERIKLDLEDLKRRREELRERMQETDRAAERGRDFIERIRPKSVVPTEEHVIIVETDKNGQVTRRVIRGEGGPRGMVRPGEDIDFDVEQWVERGGDRKLKDKMAELVERANRLRRGRPGPDGRPGREGRDAHAHGDLGHRVDRLQRHVEELTQGLHHLRQQVERLVQANKKLHMHLQGASQLRRVQVPTPPKPPKPLTLRDGRLHLGGGDGAGAMGGRGGMGGGQGDEGRLARIEALLTRLLELQIQQAKPR
jgi:chromosome segregation ATPase